MKLNFNTMAKKKNKINYIFIPFPASLTEKADGTTILVFLHLMNAEKFEKLYKAREIYNFPIVLRDLAKKVGAHYNTVVDRLELLEQAGLISIVSKAQNKNSETRLTINWDVVERYDLYGWPEIRMCKNPKSAVVERQESEEKKARLQIPENELRAIIEKSKIRNTKHQEIEVVEGHQVFSVDLPF